MAEDLLNKADEVPIALLKAMLETAEELGYDMQGYLAKAGIDRAQITQKSDHITYEQQRKFVESVVLLVDTPGFGLRVGSKISILDWGVLGYAFISSRNLRKAFDVFSTYQRLNGPMLNVFCQEEGGQGVISAVEVYPLGDVHLFAFEEWLAETRAAFDRFDIVNMEFTEVRLTYPQPQHVDLYRNLFNCPIHFEQDRNSIQFPARILELPFNMADKLVAEMCVRQCAKIMQHLSEEDPVVDAVRRILLTQPNIAPTLEVVSSHLNMSARTLRRRLQESNRSYKNILSEVRLGMAAEYLRSSQMAPKEIAYLMSYSCVSSFHRAFKQRFSMTPTEYRKHSARGNT